MIKSNPIQERRTMREIKALAERFSGDISFEEYFSNRKDAAKELLRLAQELETLMSDKVTTAINTQLAETEIESHKTF